MIKKFNQSKLSRITFKKFNNLSKAFNKKKPNLNSKLKN